MDNPSKAEHCAFCYERFRNVSAADTYLKAIRRVRDKERMAEPAPVEPAAPSPSKIPSIQIPWDHLRQSLRQGFSRYGKAGAAVLGGLLFFLLIEEGLDPATRFHYLGAQLTYAPSPKPLTYVTGSSAETRRWAERSGQMDTPLGDVHGTEVGTIKVESHKTQDKTELLTVSSNNWMLTHGAGTVAAGHVLNNGTPLLAAATMELDRRGRVIHRHEGASIRMARSMQLLVPQWPAKRLRAGDTWTDATDWSDTLEAWTFHWAVVRHWRLADPTPCGDHLCVRMTYDAVLTPHIADAPQWMAHAHWAIAPLTGSGEAVFDMTAHQMVSHRVEYAGVVRAAIADLSDIPSELRVGHRAFHVAGEIIFDLKNSLSLQRS